MREQKGIPMTTPVESPAAAPESAAPDNDNDAAVEKHPLVQECQQLAEGLAKLGVSVNFGAGVNLLDLKPAVEASAAGSLLVTKGVCTAEEWYLTVFGTLHSVLSATLQQAEEQALQAKKPKIEVARAVPTPPPPATLERRRAQRSGGAR